MSETPAAASAETPLPGETLGLGCLLLAMMGFATWDQWAIWSTKQDYTFGYLVPAFSLYVLWERWSALRPLLTGESGLPGGPSAGWLKAAARSLTML